MMTENNVESMFQLYDLKLTRLFNGPLRSFLLDNYQEQLPTWDEIPEEILCSREIYNKFARFVAQYYTIPDGVRNAGEHLSPKSALNYFVALVVKAKRKFEHNGSPATKLFFTCLDQPNGQTLPAKWYRKLKAHVLSTGFNRAADSGESLHHSSDPFYIYHHTTAEETGDMYTGKNIRSGPLLEIATGACTYEFMSPQNGHSVIDTTVFGYIHPDSLLGDNDDMPPLSSPSVSPDEAHDDDMPGLVDITTDI